MSKESQQKKLTAKARRRASRKLPPAAPVEANVPTPEPTEDELEELDSAPSTSE